MCGTKRMKKKISIKSILLLIFLLIVFIGLTFAGVPLTDNNNPHQLNYNNFSFTPLTNNGFRVEIDNREEIFLVHPTQVEYLTVPKELFNVTQAVVAFQSEPQTSSLALLLSTQLEEAGIQTTSTREGSCNKDNATTLFIIFEENPTENKLDIEDNCITIKAINDTFSLQAVERLRYALLGVIE